MDPEDVEALLRRYHGCVRSELERYSGTVEKFRDALPHSEARGACYRPGGFRERFQEQKQESCITGASRARDSTALYGKAATRKPHELAK